MNVVLQKKAVGIHLKLRASGIQSGEEHALQFWRFRRKIIGHGFAFHYIREYQPGRMRTNYGLQPTI